MRARRLSAGEGGVPGFRFWNSGGRDPGIGFPLFNFQPLGLDRQKAFHVTQEVYALLVGFCMSDGYLDLAERVTSEEPWPGDLQARLTVAVADVRGEIVEEDEAEGGF